MSQNLQKIKRVRDLMRTVDTLNLKTSPCYDKILTQDYPASVLANIFNGLGSELYMSEEVRKLGDEIFNVFEPAVLLHDIAYSTSNKSAKAFKQANMDFLENMRTLIKARVPWWRFIKRYSLRAAALVFYELVDSKLGKESFLAG